MSIFTAVISAHPIHSLDNHHHHHYHMGSLALPPRGYLYHQGPGHPLARPHVCATPVSHLDRVDSSGENTPTRWPGAELQAMLIMRSTHVLHIEKCFGRS